MKRKTHTNSEHGGPSAAQKQTNVPAHQHADGPVLGALPLWSLEYKECLLKSFASVNVATQKL